MTYIAATCTTVIPAPVAGIQLLSSTVTQELDTGDKPQYDIRVFDEHKVFKEARR